MATGRIGVTPTLRTRWSKQPSAGTTSLSGLDDNSVSLVYDVGYEAVYRNGVLLSRGNDYTATSGTSITLIDATLTGDVIEVLANQLVPLNDAISKGQFTAKGALLSATAASTPGVLAVGTNGQYLTANSSASTGLEWSTLNAGGMTLLSAQSLSAASSVSYSSLGSYKQLLLIWTGLYHSTSGSQFTLRFNNDSSSIYDFTVLSLNGTSPNTFGTNNTVAGSAIFGNESDSTTAGNTLKGFIVLDNYTSTTKYKSYYGQWFYRDTTAATQYARTISGQYSSNSAITSLDIVRVAGSATLSNNANTEIRLYGVS